MYVITFFVFDPINGMAHRGASTHVKTKVRETLRIIYMPPFTDLNTSSTVALVADMLWIITTSVHHVPNVVFRFVCGGLVTLTLTTTMCFGIRLPNELVTWHPNALVTFTLA